MRALIAVLFLAACAAGEAPAQPDAPTAAEPVAEVGAPAPPPPPATMALNCAGAFTQGGVALCRTMPGAAISVDGVASGEADENGWAVIGFNREHGPSARVEARPPAYLAWLTWGGIGLLGLFVLIIYRALCRPEPRSN